MMQMHAIRRFYALQRVHAIHRFYSTHTITFYTRKYCGLCEEAKERVLQVQKEVPFTLQEVDIDAPNNLRKYVHYTYDVPVIALNGKEIMKHSVDTIELKKWLMDS